MEYAKHGWAKGKVFAHAVGLKAGPRKLMVSAEGTTHRIENGFLVVEEPSGDPATPTNTLTIPLDNVAFIATPLFLVNSPPAGSV
jgi:hypothetical protein